MVTRSLRNRLTDSTNIWPGFVDVLATLLIVIIFVLMVFTVSQIYLSDAISGRDKALEDLRNQIDELSKILVIETKEKQQVLEDLTKTESQLQSEQKLTQQLEREAGPQEIAEMIDKPIDQVRKIMDLTGDVTSLDAPAMRDSSKKIVDTVADENMQDPADFIADFDLIIII